MFVPKGRVLLTVAVDRLAESRRTAGQTNDDAWNAARVELRGEFHSGSMLATIVHPGTVETRTIFPERWGLEKALTWLERGECLLTSGLVYPRLGISFNKDPTVSIFMSEHDLQRLMAKQEVKQEAAPRLDGKMSKPPPFSPQSERAQRYIQKLFPNGPGETTTAAIYEKLANDKDLKAELGGRAVPSTTVINRVLGRRKK